MASASEKVMEFPFVLSVKAEIQFAVTKSRVLLSSSQGFDHGGKWDN